jgi:peptidoglycan hydrolase CwlO-like protein
MHEECNCKTQNCCHTHARHFLTKQEKIKQLEDYTEQLKKEITAVEEKIKELKS